MELLICTCVFTWIIISSSVSADLNIDGNMLENSTDLNKDMYVINAMVYQIGIVTNKSDENITSPINLGNQETVTLFRNNGSTLDLSSITDPLATNVTAQHLVGFAPTDQANGPLSWSNLGSLAALPTSGSSNTDMRFVRDTYEHQDQSDEETSEEYNNSADSFMEKLFKRSSTIDQKEMPVKIVQGTGAIPPEAGLQSLAILPLLSFNNNFSEIPVPIPNTSVVHYTKVNTLVKNVP